MFVRGSSSYFRLEAHMCFKTKYKGNNCLLDKLDIKPKSILTDNGGQFKDQWANWCKLNGIKPLFAHPYYRRIKAKWRDV